MSLSLTGLGAALRLTLVSAFVALAVSAPRAEESATRAPVAAQVGEAPPIAAAADLQFALTEVAALFREQTGHSVKLTFGSSGNFFTQIGHGAPFEVFLSADEVYVKRLAEKGMTQGDGALYAIGRVVVFVPHGSPVDADSDLSGLAKALREGRVARFAIANPEHAPYGRAAREVLKARGLWEEIVPALVLGENASQAAQFASSGSVQGGIVPLSLVVQPDVAKRGTWALLPESLHTPLRQRMVLLQRAGPVATEFFNFVQEPAGRAILQRFGFVLPATN
jgi:molybdate transport system substrate-binding protein